MNQGKFLAKALYDNVAETPDELAFRRGEVLTVLEQDPGGLDGWWLCSLRGKNGIAPGNRLKIVSGMGDGGGSGASPDANLSFNGTDKRVVLGMGMFDHPSVSREDYDVPRSNKSLSMLGATSGKRPSHGTLQVPGGGLSNHLLYDTPPSSNRASGENDDGIYDTPPSSKRTSCERTPPTSNRSSASRESAGSASYLFPGSVLSHSQQSINQIHVPLGTFTLDDVRRRRSGSRSSENCYETPPGSNRSSNRSSIERILSEEGPPIYETLSPASSLEQIAQNNLEDDAIYDTPPVRNHTLSNVNPASQTSLHSAASSESLLSTTSGASASRLSQTTSLPDSARSSMDIPTDIYDVPPQSQNLDRSRKQLSMDSGLGFYDSPTKSRPTSTASATVPSQPFEGLTTSKSASDCKSTGANSDFKRSRSVENALDDIYDTPKNNSPRSGLKGTSRVASFGSSSAINDSSSNVYDVPPQVTRDSVISNRSDSSDESSRLSSSSFELDPIKMGLPLWDELLLDYDSALEVLVKRQQDISKASSRLTAFVTSIWRTRACLEKTLYDIKVSCSMVQKCLNDFVDFAQGTMANASKLSDKQLANRLYKHASPVQNTLDLINKSFSNLEEMKWQVSLLSEPLDKSKPDDLGQIALVAKDLMIDVKRVASFIQSNSQYLFKKTSPLDFKKSVSSKPPIVPKSGDYNGGKIGNGYGYAKLKSMQQRPLPAVPLPEKRLPSSSPTTNLSIGSSSMKGDGQDNHKMSMYAIKESLHKDDYAECDELFDRKGDSLSYDKDDKHYGQEYDYVQLDDNDTLTRSPSKHSKDHSKRQRVEENIEIEKSHNNQNNTKVNDVIEYANDISDKEELEIKTSELTLDEKDGEKIFENNTKVNHYKDDDVDMVPVKESSTLERPKDKNKTAVSHTESETLSQTDFAVREHNLLNYNNLEPEPEPEDLKTPVNINSMDVSNFPLPDIATPTATGGVPSMDEAFEPEQLDPNDHQVLVHYAEQMNSHSTLLANSIDAFIGVVGANQPPNVFISHSKFVIVSAHKLVHIGDTVHRNLASNAISARVMHSANHLCDCLKASVNATKMAALQYPSPVAIQEMVDRVIAVSHAAHQLKVIITQAHRQ